MLSAGDRIAVLICQEYPVGGIDHKVHRKQN